MILCLLSPTAIHAAAVFSEEKLVGLLAAGDQNQAKAEVVKCIREGDRSPKAIFWAAVLARSRFNTEASTPFLVHLLATQSESLEGRASGFILGIYTAKDSRTELFYYNALIAQTALEPNSIPLQWLSGIMARRITKKERRSDITSETRKRILAWGVASYSKMLSLLGVDEVPREKAESILKNSTQYIAKKFAGWSTFLDSFLMAATRHNGWESECYGYITKLLAVNAPDWPKPEK